MKFKYIAIIFAVAAVLGLVTAFSIAIDNGLYKGGIAIAPEEIDLPAATVTDIPGQAVTDVEIIELPLDIPQVFLDGLEQGFITAPEYSQLMDAYNKLN